MQILGLIVIGIVIGIIASAIGTGDIFELNFLGTVVGVIAAALFIGAADSGGLGKGGRRDALGRG